MSGFRLARTPQLCGEFEPGDPQSGYYNDLRPELLAVTPGDARDRLRVLLASSRVNPVSVAQLGLAAWQRRAEGPGWRDAAAAVARALVQRMDGAGGLPFDWPMPHTYRIDAPWISALAQGEAASLFVRCVGLVDDLDLEDAALQVVRPLIEPSPLVAATSEGPVLQEYPAVPAPHVLNGWIYALWGLYDVANTTSDPRPAEAFATGVDTLVARLPLYEVFGGWSRYDLFPHRIVHVASPFYHRLHVEQLRALERLVPGRGFGEWVARWQSALTRRDVVALAVARKVAFRMLQPRRTHRPARTGASQPTPRP